MRPQPSPNAAARAARVTALLSIMQATLWVPRLPGQQPSDRSPASAWRARLLKAASDVAFGPARPAVSGAEPDGAPAARAADTSATPALTFAPARRPPKTGAGVAGRITSTSGHPNLGIAPGVNYLWVVQGVPERIAIVPADPARPAHWLAVATHPAGRRRAAGWFELVELAPSSRARVCIPHGRVHIQADSLSIEATARNARVLLGRP